MDLLAGADANRLFRRSPPPEAKGALRLLFLRETAATYPDELRKLLGMNFTLEQSCAALGATKDADRALEVAVGLLLSSLAEGATLPAPSATFRGRVTDLLRSGEYISESDSKQLKQLKAAEQQRLLGVLRSANVRDGTSKYQNLTASAKAALTEQFVIETASHYPDEMRKLLELGFSLRDSASALGSCKSTSHVLETSVCRLLEARRQRRLPLPLHASSNQLPCPSVEFRSRVTDLLRSGEYVSETASREEEKWLLLVLRQCGVSDSTQSWSRLPDTAQDAMHQVFMRQTAASYPKELRQLLKLGFPLVGCCAALGSCHLQPGAHHVVETCMLRLLDDTAPLWAPSADFRGRITSVLRSGAYVSAETEAAKAAADMDENKLLLNVLRDANVRNGSKAWSDLSSKAQLALHRHHIREVATAHPRELKLLMNACSSPSRRGSRVGCTLGAACAALSASKAPADNLLEDAFSRIISGKHTNGGPSEEFRGQVTKLLRSGAYIHIAALCAPDIGELEKKLCTSGLLSPSATPPGSPAREIPGELPGHPGAAGIVMPDLRLSKGGAVVRSSSAEGQIRILKQLYEDGVLSSADYSAKAATVLDRVDMAATIDLGSRPWHVAA